MKREILYRGKTLIDNKWIYGYLSTVDKSGVPVILEPEKENHWMKVHPETVGQYTGLKDRNGVKIFEGDIVKEGLYKYTIEYYKYGFWANGGQRGATWELRKFENQCEIIGNIHDNPDLLKETA